MSYRKSILNSNRRSVDELVDLNDVDVWKQSLMADSEQVFVQLAELQALLTETLLRHFALLKMTKGRPSKANTSVWGLIP